MKSLAPSQALGCTYPHWASQPLPESAVHTFLSALWPEVSLGLDTPLGLFLWSAEIQATMIFVPFPLTSESLPNWFSGCREAPSSHQT